jgi:hypothetical protein
MQHVMELRHYDNEIFSSDQLCQAKIKHSMCVMFEGDVVDHVKDFISLSHDENFMFIIKIKL